MPRLLPRPSNEVTGEPSFRWRRIAFFGMMGFCLAFLPVLAFLPEIPTNNLRVAESLIDLAGWAFLVYAAGASAQDITAIVTTKSARPYVPTSGKVETTQTTTTVVAPDPNAQPPQDPTVPPPGFAGG